MIPAIHERGRGPEIVGSRITVYDVLAETRAGVPVAQLASEWNLTAEQIEYALKYIDDHREDVERDWAAIQARRERERQESHEKYGHVFAAGREARLRWKAEYDRRQAGAEPNARPPRGREHPGSNGELPGHPGNNGVG
jgi:uncharacterized protein (DUF433 family)